MTRVYEKDTDNFFAAAFLRNREFGALFLAATGRAADVQVASWARSKKGSRRHEALPGGGTGTAACLQKNNDREPHEPHRQHDRQTACDERCANFGPAR